MAGIRFGVAAVAMLAGVASAQNLVSNGSFEIDGPPPFVLFQNWENYNNVFADDSDEVAAQDGTTSAKMFGQFGGSQSDQVLQQFVTGITPGQQYTLSAYALHNSFDAVAAGNLVLLQLNFLSAPVPNAGIETVEVVAIEPGVTPTDAWGRVEVSGIAPPGTTAVLVALLHLQLDGLAPGATFWDNVELIEGPPPVDCVADINGDGSVNFADVQAFVTAFQQGCP